MYVMANVYSELRKCGVCGRIGRFTMKHEIEEYQTYRCKINIRPEYEGSPLIREVLDFNGMEMELMCMWKFDADERYHGEYALCPVSKEDKEKLWQKKVVWFASGDVEVL